LDLAELAALRLILRPPHKGLPNRVAYSCARANFSAFFCFRRRFIPDTIRAASIFPDLRLRSLDSSIDTFRDSSCAVLGIEDFIKNLPAFSVRFWLRQINAALTESVRRVFKKVKSEIRIVHKSGPQITNRLGSPALRIDQLIQRYETALDTGAVEHRSQRIVERAVYIQNRDSLSGPPRLLNQTAGMLVLRRSREFSHLCSPEMTQAF
jgi:hypothetical protein